MPADNVKKYYDNFSKEVLVEDFRKRNLRQVAIRDLCKRFIPTGARVLEIGCGTGIISKFLSKTASLVFSIDISPNNIKVAKAYASSEINHFEVMDVCRETKKLAGQAPFDAIVLPDVIEHIPLSEHRKIFQVLTTLLADQGIIILTYPSPAYQNYLKTNSPDRLQIVDEEIELTRIIEDSTLNPIFFSLVDIWQKGQYSHLVLSMNQGFEPLPLRRSLLSKLLNIVRGSAWHISNLSFLRKTDNVL